MANLATTLQALGMSKARSLNVIKCYKTKTELGAISASSEEFFLVRFPLKRVALSASSRRDSNDVVLDVNSLGLGKANSGYVPKVCIVKGHSRIEELKASEESYVDAWLGVNAMRKFNIQADDAISSNELASKLNGLVSKNVDTPAWIKDIYPFERYFIFEKAGDNFRQDYVADPVSREVALSGKPVKVYQEYNTVPKGEIAAQILEGPTFSQPVLGVVNDYYTNTISQEMSYDPVNSQSLAIGGIHGPDNKEAGSVFIRYGPPNSELNNPPIRTMTNVEEALRIYLGQLKTGSYTPLSSISSSMLPTKGKEYLNACREAEIVARLAGAKINYRDFVWWQHKTLMASKTDPSVKSQKAKIPEIQAPKVSAGGPGSGRKPGPGVKVDKSTHKSFAHAKAALDKQQAFWSGMKKQGKENVKKVVRHDDNGMSVHFNDGKTLHHETVTHPSSIIKTGSGPVPMKNPKAQVQTWTE